jgi:hypothetical protein
LYVEGGAINRRILGLLENAFQPLITAPHKIDMRGFAALAAAIREDAAPALKEINFESFNGGDMGGDSTALKEACEARGIALSITDFRIP